MPPYFTQNIRNIYDGFYATFSGVINDVSMQYGVNYATFALCLLFLSHLPSGCCQNSSRRATNPLDSPKL